ncbi:MAG TPA: adenylate/guanylate cyclase domain-containing protein [Jiangellaceae bacterium]
MTTEPPKLTPEDLERLLLGADVRYTREDVASATGVTVSVAREYWRALGYPDTGPAVAFTARDIDALREALGLVDSGVIDQDSMVQLVRGLGRMMSRLAEWHTETVAAVVDNLYSATADEGDDGAGDPTDDGATPERPDRLAIAYELADEIVPVFERLLVYAWRRKLALAAGRLMALGDIGDGSLLSTHMTVGFADLVSFTRLSTSLTARALSEFIEVFEATSSDVIVAGGGRVIKTMGDEVLFVANTPEAAGSIAAELVDVIGQNPTLPNIRVGLATGPVVTRHGDVFGDPANLASRLMSLAGRNVVLTDQATATDLSDDPNFTVRRRDPTEVRGFGLVEPYELTRRPTGRVPQARAEGIRSPS